MRPIQLDKSFIFDECKEPYDDESLELVYDFSMSLIRIIETRLDYEELKELYEQQHQIVVIFTFLTIFIYLIIFNQILHK